MPVVINRAEMNIAAVTTQRDRGQEAFVAEAVPWLRPAGSASSGIRPLVDDGARPVGMTALAAAAETWPPGQGNSGAPDAGAAAGAGADVCSGPGPNSSTGAPAVVVAGGETAADCSCCVAFRLVAVAA
jgi:hypothetical protein